MTRHWAEDEYWTAALADYSALRQSGQRSLTIDLDRLEEVIFNGDSPAYQLVDAMCSIREHEGQDGFRGAPRLVMALLVRLAECCRTDG